MPLSHEDENALKKPFGILIPDIDITKEKILSLLENAKKVIAVGDATTERLVSFGIIPDLAVIDGKERRHARLSRANYVAEEKHCKNPAGGISNECVEMLKAVLEENLPVRVVVQGEEDMLALPLFVISPLGTVVLYGQPLEGVVAVKITKAKRKQAKDLMDRITENVKSFNRA